MARKFKNHTLSEYLDVLSRKTPVPGGGSAAALNAALGVSLISKVANYSKGKSPSKIIEKRIQKIIHESTKIRKRLLELVDRDAEAYLQVVKTRQASAKVKMSAQKACQRIPLEVCKLCYQAVQLAPHLVKHGNKYLMSDLEAALEMLMASYHSAMGFTKTG